MEAAVVTQEPTASITSPTASVPRYGVAFSVALLVMAATLQAASAQVVRGRLVDAANDTGISGAMLTLLDACGDGLDTGSGNV